jgi:opacity protein-like surface antigen
MSRSLILRATLVAALVLATSSVASADITAFLGTSRVRAAPEVVALGAPGSEFRVSKGLAVGFSLVIVGFEFEWADTGGSELCLGNTVANSLCAPSVMTGMGNVLLQTPRGVSPVQVYGTVGAGVYRERYEFPDSVDIPDEHEYGVGTNIGGGVKIDVAGPFRVRIDYRIFKLANDAYNSTPQRLYVGANLAF